MKDVKLKDKWEVQAYRWVSLCEDEIVTWSDCQEFTLHRCTLDWSVRRKSSRGGWYASGPGINIAMNISVKNFNEVFRVYEYPSFDAHPVIGGFYAEDYNLKLGMIICHEMAHAVQYFRIKHLGHLRGKPHGVDFKTPYAALRKKILNPKLPNQKITKNKYEELVNSIVKNT